MSSCCSLLALQVQSDIDAVCPSGSLLQNSTADSTVRWDPDGKVMVVKNMHELVQEFKSEGYRMTSVGSLWRSMNVSRGDPGLTLPK